MIQSFLRRSLIIAQMLIALICVSTTPVWAHAGHHHSHEHQATSKATGGDFTLQSANGPVSLSDFKNKIIAIYFGYTHCTDACPADLGRLATALKSLKPEEVAEIQPLFITVDPKRDNADIMANYSAKFHPKLIGLTGSADEISAVAKAYGANYTIGPTNDNGDYDIEHASTIYLVGKDGKLLHSLPQSPAHIVAALRKALKAQR